MYSLFILQLGAYLTKMLTLNLIMIHIILIDKMTTEDQQLLHNFIVITPVHIKSSCQEAIVSLNRTKQCIDNNTESKGFLLEVDYYVAKRPLYGTNIKKSLNQVIY